MRTMNRPYRRFYLTRLREIARENWNSIHELKQIFIEIAERKLRGDIVQFYAEVGNRIKKLESEAKQEGENRKEIQRLAYEEERALARKRGWFRWPTTNAPMGDGKMDAYWYEQGLFSYVGYHVGNDGESVEIRRQLLDCIFHNELPNVESEEYMDGFHLPKTPQRLKKMADFLSSQARSFKRNMNTHGADYGKAVADYQSDLDYLYHEYYVNAFHFDSGWPTV